MPVSPATPETIARAAAALRDGRLVAFPTETVYGLGADATNGEAVARIYEAKGRPRFNPLIAHCADFAAVEAIAELNDTAHRLAQAFWPGPLTLVLPRRPGSGLSDLATAGLDTVAIRVPDHPIAQALLKACGRPVAAPSANRSGHVSPTTAQHVDADLGAILATVGGLILDAGPCAHGLESTIIEPRADGLVLLRSGAVTAETIAATLGLTVTRHTESVGDRPVAPGQLESHYAPRASLRLGATDVRSGEALLAFGMPLSSHGPVINLSPSGNLVEAASRLFAAVRALDATGASAIAAMAIPDTGLGEAINDRLRRAAAPRG